MKGRSAEGSGPLQERILVVIANSIATVIKRLMERYQFIWTLHRGIRIQNCWHTANSLIFFIGR